MAQVSEQTEHQTLVEGLRPRDEGAVAALLDHYWAPAYQVAFGICADAASAEDLAHEGPRPSDFQRYDLVWAQRAPEEHERVGQGAPDVVSSLSPTAQRSFRITLMTRDDAAVAQRSQEVTFDVSALDLPGDLLGRPLAARADQVKVVVPRHGSLGFRQRSLTSLAKSLRQALEQEGFELRLAFGSEAERADVALFVAPTAGGVPLARYDSLLLPGRLDPGATLDHNGFLIWPPRVTTPDPRRVGNRKAPRLR